MPAGMVRAQMGYPPPLTASADTPPWFVPDDPWLSRRMRDIAAIAENEAALGNAVMSAIGEYLEAARRGLLGLPALTAAAGDVPPPPEDPGDRNAAPDWDGWPSLDVWKASVDRLIMPVVGGIFGERFKLETARALIKDAPWRLSWLQNVWSRLKIWPQNAWEEIRPELLEGISEGESIPDLRDRVGRVLNIDALSRRIMADINGLVKVINDPTSLPAEIRAAKARRSELYQSKRQEDKRWWFFAARIARTETMGAMNGGTYAGAVAYAEISQETRYKQWWSTSDTRVRNSHWAAHMQVRPLTEKFSVGGYSLEHPGDPDGPGHEVINCRCSLLTMGKAAAEKQEALYEQYRGTRTDKHGNPLDDDGRPMVAAATAGGSDMTGPAGATLAADDVPPEVEPEPTPDGMPDDLFALLPPGATTVGWRGPLAPLDVQSGDRRIIATPPGGTLSTRELPLVMLYQERLNPGHDDAANVARIDRAWIENGYVWGEGLFDLTDPDAVKAASKIHRGFHRWVSVDLDQVTSEWACYRDDAPVDCPTFDEEDLDWLFLPASQRPALSPSQQKRMRARRGAGYADTDAAVDDPWAGIVEVEVSTDWRLMGATLVSQPAFHDAAIELVFDYQPAAAGDAPAGDSAAAGQQSAGTFAITGDTSLPLAPLDTAWDAAAAGERVAEWAAGEPGNLGAAHLWLDPDGDSADPSAYWGLFADVTDDYLTAVPNAIMAAADGVDSVPEEDRDAVRGELDALYARMREEFDDDSLTPPWADEPDDDVDAPPVDAPNQASAVTAPPLAASVRITGRTSTTRGTISPVPAGPHRSTVATALVASAAPVKPPAEWFGDPGLSGPTALTITDDGQVYGHAAIWDTCHVGYPGQCVTPPRSADYGQFHGGVVRTSEGLDIAVGSIVLGTGHADVDRSTTVAQAMAHYDNSGWGVALVRAGEDEHGVWVAGSLAPDVDELRLASLRRCTLSGDWRVVSGRAAFIAALAVNVGGFTVRRQTDDDGRVVALVAAGSIRAGHLAHGQVATAEVELPEQPAPSAPAVMPTPAEYAVAVVGELEALADRKAVTALLARRVYGQAVGMLAKRVHARKLPPQPHVRKNPKGQ
jgi:hypothetical protein